MNSPPTRRLARRFAHSLCAVALLAGLTACNDTNNPPLLMPPGTPPPTAPAVMQTVSGVAALGAPLSGASIALRCTGFEGSSTSSGNGAWSATVPQSALPCAIQLTGGMVGGAVNSLTLHSFVAAGSGNLGAQITPLTELVLARAVQSATGQTLADWFASSTLSSSFGPVGSALADAVSALQTALGNAGYTVPANFAPLTQGFTAAAGDPYDDLLEALRAGLEASSQTYAQMTTSFASGGALPAAEASNGPAEPDPEAPEGIELVTAYAGSYSVQATSGSHARGTVVIGSDGQIDFDSDKSFAPAEFLGIFDRRNVSDSAGGPRIQVELAETATLPQRRVRLFVDTATDTAIGFAFYPDVTGNNPDANAVVVTVTDDAPATPVEPAPTPTGDGAALNGGNGATGTVGSTSYAYTANVQWGASGNFLAAQDGITRWDIGTLPLSTGTVACKSNETQPRIQLTVAGVVYSTAPDAGSCSIEITTVSSTEVEGRFAATLIAQDGSVFGTVRDGYFRSRVAAGGGSSGPDLPPGSIDREASGFNTNQSGNNTAAVNAAVDAFSGRFAVAIYSTPVGEEAKLGRATLVISRSGDTATAQLLDADGNALADVQAVPTDGSENGQGNRVQVLGFGDRRTLEVRRFASAYRNVTPTFAADGSISGLVGDTDTGIFLFRNHIVSFGSTVPAVFGLIDGSWRGPQLANTCGKPDVTVTISEAGAVTNAGTASVDCSAQSISSTWDGQDDFIVPYVLDRGDGTSQQGFEIVLNTTRNGGSSPSGGIRIRVDSVTAPSGLDEVFSGINGSAGNIEVVDPVLQP